MVEGARIDNRSIAAGAKVRFGLIGCGRIGAFGDERAAAWPDAKAWLPYSHASAILAAGGELAAICDADVRALEACAERFSVQKRYTDYRAMLSAERLDVISIATRAQGRAELIAHASSRGIKGIYCEKPLSNTLEQADWVARALTEAGTSFLYGPQRRYMLAFTDAMAQLRAGRIGQLRDIAIRWPAGALLWRHPHSVDLACFFAGDAPVLSVDADLDIAPASVNRQVVDADPIVRSANVQFSNGVRAHVVADDANTVDLKGDSGSLTIEQDGMRAFLRAAGMSTEVTVSPGLSGTAIAMREMIACVRGAVRPRYTIANAVLNQEILFGWLESSLLGRAKIGFPMGRTGRTITGRTGNRFA